MAMQKKKKLNVICIICGILAAVCILLYTQSVKASADSARNQALAKYGGEQVEVCVAVRDIAAGETIDSTCFDTKLWVSDLLPTDAVRNANEIVGKQTTSSIVNGEVISSKRFTDQQISLEVPAGLTAVSVPAKDVSAVGGAIMAGSHVDVYSTGNSSTTLIAQDVLVLATSTTFTENNSSSSSSSSMKWLTLAVEPAKVNEIVSASQKTDLYFVMPSEETDSGEDSKTVHTESGEKTESSTNPNNLQDALDNADKMSAEQKSSSSQSSSQKSGS